MSDSPGSGGSLRRSVKVGVAWSTLTFGLTKLLTSVSLLVFARLLAPSQFGVVAAVAVVLSFVELTSDLGMKATVIYEQEGARGKRIETAFTLNILVAAAMAAVAVLAAPAVASFFHATRHVGLFRLAGLDIFFTGLGGIHDGLLLRDLRFRTRIVTEMIGAVARNGVGIGLAFAGFGAASLVWGFIAGTFAWTVALWLLTGFRPRLRVDRKVAKSMASYGMGATMLALLSQLTTQADVGVVGRVLGQRALGLYTVALRLPSLLLENIAYQVSLVAFPALARKRATDADGLAASTQRLVRYQSLYALPLAAGMAVLARPIVQTVFSSKWLPAAGVFAAVAVMSGASASAFALGDAFKALGRQRVMVWLNLLGLPLLVVTIILVAPYGITAVAWVRAGTIVLWVVLMTVAAARVLRAPVRTTLLAMWPGTAAAAGVTVSAGAVRLFSGLGTVEQLAAGTVAGSAGAVIALALLAPATFRELRAAAALPRRRRNATGSPPAAEVVPLTAAADDLHNDGVLR